MANFISTSYVTLDPACWLAAIWWWRRRPDRLRIIVAANRFVHNTQRSLRVNGLPNWVTGPEQPLACHTQRVSQLNTHVHHLYRIRSGPTLHASHNGDENTAYSLATISTGLYDCNLISVWLSTILPCWKLCCNSTTVNGSCIKYLVICRW